MESRNLTENNFRLLRALDGQELKKIVLLVVVNGVHLYVHYHGTLHAYNKVIKYYET